MQELDKLSNIDLIKHYSSIIELLKKRGIIRTKNIVGELGEYYAIEYYNNTSGLPKLQAAPPSTANIDAISVNGDRYSIKTITGKNKVTGVFYGLKDPKLGHKDIQKFEYLLIVILDDNYALSKIYVLTWIQFLKYKKWHSRMKAWNVGINQKLIDEAQVLE